jgi:HD superfamily phosphohydrolase YqeK
MPITSFETIKQNLLTKLNGLDPRLSYHNIDHTLDVLQQAERIAKDEEINDERDRYLLKIAALYHDAGFLKIYDGHEEESCKLFLQDAIDFDLDETELKLVQGLIMATKLTNEPHTHLEKILRDADLDYLGRRDFDEISTRLKEELLQYGFIADDNEWEARQLAFLKKHSYHTRSSKAIRGPGKQKNYLALV